MADNNFKNRKSEAQENFEVAENAGRFAGNDADARTARQQAEENIRRDANSGREGSNADDRESTDKDAAGMMPRLMI